MPSQEKRKRNVKVEPTSTCEFVEVVDALDRPIAVLPLLEVHRQRLRHRSVMVLVYDLHGKVFLQKRNAAKTVYPGRWDLSATGHVRAGESREDAALRELDEELGIRVESLELRHCVDAGPDTNWEFVSLYSAGRLAQRPEPNPQELSGGYFFDQQELECLVATFPDMLTPGLIHFWENGLIFSSPDPQSA